VAETESVDIMATTARKTAATQTANALWTLIEQQSLEVKVYLHGMIGRSMEKESGRAEMRTSGAEIVDNLCGVLKDIPQSVFADDEGAQYILGGHLVVEESDHKATNL